MVSTCVLHPVMQSLCLSEVDSQLKSKLLKSFRKGPMTTRRKEGRREGMLLATYTYLSTLLIWSQCYNTKPILRRAIRSLVSRSEVNHIKSVRPWKVSGQVKALPNFKVATGLEKGTNCTCTGMQKGANHRVGTYAATYKLRRHIS